MKLRPLYDRILIKRLDAAQKTAGGLFLPESAKEKPQEAEVIAVGPGKSTDDGDKREMSVKPGDIVLIGKFTGDEISIDGEELIILQETDILAVVERS